MKRTLFSLSMVILCTVAALSQNKILKKYADEKYVKTEYYTGDAIKLTANQFLVEQLNFNQIIGRIDNIQILTIDDSEAYSQIASDISKEFYHNKSYKEILNIIKNESEHETDDNKIVDFGRYTVLSKKISGKKSQYVLIYDNNDNKDLTISIIEGKLTAEDAGIVWRNACILLNDKIELQSYNLDFFYIEPWYAKMLPKKSDIESVTSFVYNGGGNTSISNLNKIALNLFTPTFKNFNAVMSVGDSNESQWIFTQNAENILNKYVLAQYAGSNTSITIFIDKATAAK